MTKEEIVKRITKFGKEIDPNTVEWWENRHRITIREDNLCFDFDSYPFMHISFVTGSNCTFNTGSGCIFNTGLNCTFDTGSNCTFDTGLNCTFNTGLNCTFNTGSNCTFDTGRSCTFNTGSNCTFDTGRSCTFDTGQDCSLRTGDRCIFFMNGNCNFFVGSESIYYRTDIDDFGKLLPRHYIKILNEKGFITIDKIFKVSVGDVEIQLTILVESDCPELAETKALEIFNEKFPECKEEKRNITTQIIQ